MEKPTTPPLQRSQPSTTPPIRCHSLLFVFHGGGRTYELTVKYVDHPMDYKPNKSASKTPSSKKPLSLVRTSPSGIWALC
ncbi:hypothetical protein NFJ02_32g81250 [Pycnococcus provasolii]